MTAVVVLGQATPPGRLAAAAAVIGSACSALGDDVTAVDLSDVVLPFADGRPDDEHDLAARSVLEAFAAARTVFLCSPVYRASCPGVLKNALDLLPVDALRDKPVGIVAMGGSPHHYLAVDAALRPVLAWFGALPAPTSVYLTGRDFTDGRPTSGAADELRQLVASVHLLSTSVSGRRLGPDPLAARF